MGEKDRERLWKLFLVYLDRDKLRLDIEEHEIAKVSLDNALEAFKIWKEEVE